MTEIHSRLAGNSKASLVFYRFGRGLCVGFCRVWLRLSVEGREHVPPDGAFVLAPVHRSNMDTPIAAVCTKRRMRYMGKDSLWKVRFFGWLLSALGGFPVSRGTIDREALARCTALLEEGHTDAIARAVRDVLSGWLVLEVHEDRARVMSDELARLGFQGISIGLDLAGRERVLEARWRSMATSNGS